MLNFPVPYPEELIYSTIARAGIRQGITSPKELLDEIFQSRGIIATIDLPNHLSAVSRLLPKKYSAEEIIYNHTLFPIYAPFVPEERRKRCLEWMRKKSQGAVHLALGVTASRIKVPRYIRYCPRCILAQNNEHGEYYWIRGWQVPGIESCSKHGYLINTQLLRSNAERHRFIAAAPEYCPQVPQNQCASTSTWISIQVQQLLERSIRPSASYEQWTTYYKDLAFQYGFNRGNGHIRHHAVKEKVLRAWPIDWLAKYNLTPTESDDNETDWLRSIFRKHRKCFSYLQHIVVNQAIVGESWCIDNVLDQVQQYLVKKRLPSFQKTQSIKLDLAPDQENWQRLLSFHSPTKARKISPALYGRLYRSHLPWLLEVNACHADDRSGFALRRKVDWNARDQEYLQVLRQVTASLDGSADGPRRSKAYFHKLAGLSTTFQKNLNRMPLSEAFLDDHVESVEGYQIRRLRNSFQELQQQFDTPPLWRLLRKAKLSKERLTEASKHYLNILDL
ncbi:transcriptional antiterminator [Desulfonatronum sp. SC1]|nr:transcriptional antiterminator [Desulfonatronum sp. SC1]